ncbi:MAG: iron chelate uptake ABC transporter family permease subunit [Thermoplasmata archaeon]|nr:iron chelate uptake ABC transporter family permease subunit [Thermoplasmata archaeon]
MSQSNLPLSLALSVLTFLILITLIISAVLGPATEEFKELRVFEKVKHIVRATVSETGMPVMDNIVRLRLSRLALTILVGMALSGAGVIMQGFFQNPMASPYILGISAGGVLGITAAGLLGINFIFIGLSSNSIMAFAGGLSVTLIVYLLSLRGGRVHGPTLLLTGIAVGTLAMGLAWFVMFLKTYNYDEIIFWLMGTFNGKGMDEVKMILPIVCIGVILIMIFARDLNILILGRDTARHLGVNVEKIRVILLIVATLLAAAAVAAVGIVAFVGLVVPHLVRIIVGPDHRRLIPASLLAGGLLVMIADTFSRVVLGELVPIGIITSVIGCPFFLYLLSRREKSFF